MLPSIDVARKAPKELLAFAKSTSIFQDFKADEKP